MLLRCYALMLLWLPAMVVGYPLEKLSLHREDVGVYDGDTLHVTIPWVPDVFGDALKVRIRGIDTPEIRSYCSTDVLKQQERDYGHLVRQYVEERLRQTQRVTLVELERDKYFRINARVLFDETDLGEELLVRHYAVTYDGQTTKPSWCGLTPSETP